jgi:hypothetical protein|tara:strand:+ start:707 stop:1456 length:750 start_codon:yes stop_codon:yes gene_type:complete
MVTTSNLEENGGNSFQGQFEEGEDYGLPQLDFSPLDPLEFNEIGIKTPSSGSSMFDENQTTPDLEESMSPPLVEIEETSAYIYQADGNQKLKFIFVVVLGILSASIIGVTLLSMAVDSEPAVKEEVKKEVKKEIIPEPVIEEVIESEVTTELPEPVLESISEASGTISEITQPLNKYYLIVASFFDKDLAIDYADKLILSGSNVIIIPPFSKSKFTRVALGEYETLEKVSAGINNYKDEFDEQLWVLKY